MQPKVQALVAKTANMEVTITDSDTEALLLEFNLIKKHRPRFNVVLRDDKSFPLLAPGDEGTTSPRLNFYRGSRKEAGRFFGPYPSAGAVSRGSSASCRSSFASATAMIFTSPTARAPACNTQIERCTGPCVGLIAKEDYARDVEFGDQGAGRAKRRGAGRARSGAWRWRPSS